jgi:5-oxopent-3-ene-1,2,5-tricarboxylate decarboxylase / 2-hydroxyhepta-2,4-diene-1,7-dioate isomerase
VMPGDIIVGDGEGAVVIPPSLVVELAAASVQQEAEESWALERVDAGESTVGVFPVSKERRAEFEAWHAAKQETGT